MNDKKRTPEETKTIMTQLVLPNDTNLLGNLLGGSLMHWIDIAAALSASRHSNKVVATAALEDLDFRHPVRLGEMVVLTAKLIWCGRTSMTVAVTVEAENLISGHRIITNQAKLVFVAMDENSRPCPVPGLDPQTEEEKALFEEEQKKYEARKAAKKA